jgi:hypothetical protein
MDKDGKQLNFMNDAANKIVFNQHLSESNTKEMTEDQLLMRSEKQEI